MKKDRTARTWLAKGSAGGRLRLQLTVLLGLLAGPAPGQGPRILPRDTLLAQLARPHLPDTVRVQHLTHLSGYFRSAALPRARQYGEQAVALARRIGYGRGEARALGNLAGIDYTSGDYPAAQRRFEQALAAARRTGLPEQLGHACLGLGNVAQALGDAPQALRRFAEARTAYAACPPATRRIGQLLVYLNSANAYYELKQPAAAGRSLHLALGSTDAATPPRLLARVLTELGRAQLAAGAPDSAQALLRRALAVAARRQLPQYEADAQVVLAEAALAQHRPEQARQLALQALRLNQTTGDPSTRHDALRQLAAALHALRRPEAYDTLARYLVLHDTLADQDRAEAVLTAAARFNSQEQQAKIRQLEQDRQLGSQRAELARLRARQQLLLAGVALWTLLLAAGALFWRYRRRQAAQLAASATELRERLAADLHDDVGNLLTQLNMQTELLRTPHAQTPEQLAEHLARLAATARRASQQMSDVVRGLHQPAPTLPELLDRLRDHTHEVCHPLGLEVDFDVSPAAAATPLPPAALHALYLIFKEALHNIVKHAQATRVTVRLARTAAGLCLTVHDNGQGPDGLPDPDGRGLRNMQARARALGGTVRYETLAPGFGVVVELP